MATLATDDQHPDLVVTLVHGTYPRGGAWQVRRNIGAAFDALRGVVRDEADRWPAARKNSPYWFEAGSGFVTTVVDGMRTACRVRVERACWSGVNSFAERESAAERLAQTLGATSTRFPDVPHVVVAHSHGGTVAARALATRGADEHRRVASLVTLGTPFIRLSPEPSADQNTADVGLVHLVATLLPPTLLALAPMGALSYGLRADGPLQVGLAVGVGLVSLVAALRLRVRTSALIAFALFLDGGAAVRSDMLALSFLAICLGLPLSRRIVEAGVAHVDRGPLRLDVPLLALQGARDEAARAIGLGQLASTVAQVLARGVVATLAPVGRLWARVGGVEGEAAGRVRRILEHVRGIGAAILMGWVVFALVVAVRWLIGWPVTLDSIGPPWVTVLVWSVLGAGGGLVLIVTVALAFLLAWTIPTMVLSLVAGPEVLLLPLLTQVDAEPLPWAERSDGTRADMRLEILYDARGIGLAHSVHEAATLRARVAAHLDEVMGHE